MTVWLAHPACGLLVFSVILGLSIAKRGSTQVGDESSESETDVRLIHPPEVWKIRDPQSGSSYLTYHFFLGSNWTSLKAHYPECSSVACLGLPASYRECEKLCSYGTWNDVSAALASVTRDYDETAARLDAAFNDLAALVDARLVDETSPLSPGLSAVDILRDDRRSIEKALSDLGASKGLDTGEDGVAAGGLVNIMESWKTGVFKYSAQLNVVTSALQRARARLQLCAHAIRLSDMIGCKSGFAIDRVADVPVNARLLSSSQFSVVVKRVPWTPITLSPWSMHFLDTSRNNRTCWLDRLMVNDSYANYRAPRCDTRGLCEPPEPDEDTIRRCRVTERGKLSVDCPITCGHRCFGSICYDEQLGIYRQKSGEPLPGETSAIPVMLTDVYSWSDSDLKDSVVRAQDLLGRAAELLASGEQLLLGVKDVNAAVEKYTQRAHVTSSVMCAHETKCIADCEETMSRSRIVASAALVLSVITLPLLIILILKRQDGFVTTSRVAERLP